jgi:hypothetical protein
MSSMPFRVKTVIFGQNRVHRVNTGPTMSTGLKNEFQASFWSKLLFLVKTRSTGLKPIESFFLVSQHNFRSLKLIFSG